MEKLYVVWIDNHSISIVKARNKREAIDLVYKNECGDYPKNAMTALDVEREMFKHNGFDRRVATIL